MAKITFSKLGLKKQNKIETVNINGIDIGGGEFLELEPF